MPRPTTIAIYSAVFGVALLAGLFIATVLRPRSLPAANFAASPTATQIVATATQALAAVSPMVQPLPSSAVSERVSAERSSALDLSVALPTTTPMPQPASPTPIPATPTAPPTEPPRPLVFAARIFDQPTDAAVACGTAFESRIWGVVMDRAGHAIYRAQILVSSADGRNRYSRVTNSQGGFEVPGLGCTTWIVRLASVPRAPNGLQAQSVRVSLNGGRYSGAGVEFRQR